VYEATLERFNTPEHRGKRHEELMRCLKFGAGCFYFLMSIVPTKYLRFA
jgi:hypothetical protein